jgi:hypothetical protein
LARAEREFSAAQARALPSRFRAHHQRARDQAIISRNGPECFSMVRFDPKGTADPHTLRRVLFLWP